MTTVATHTRSDITDLTEKRTADVRFTQGSPYRHASIVAGMTQETPYMVTDLSHIRSQCALFKQSLPGVQLFYAVKAYADKAVITAVQHDVDGYDVASLNEIKLLLDCSVDPAVIAFSNPVKPPHAISAAAELGVAMFAYQSFAELDKIAENAPGTGVYVRVAMDDSHSEVPLSSKFGCRPGEALALLQAAHDKGLQALGLTFHVGSQSTDTATWNSAITESIAIVRQARQAGLAVSMINIGGGFPANYFAADTGFPEVAQAVTADLADLHDIRIIAEPGRMIVADSSSIVSSVIGIERRHGETWVYLDVGVYQAFAGALRYDHFPYSPYSLRHYASATSQTGQDVADTAYEPCVITGPSCDSHDVIATEILLPSDLQIGDKLVFPNTGAYTISYGSNFNGFEIPPRYYYGE